MISSYFFEFLIFFDVDLVGWYGLYIGKVWVYIDGVWIVSEFSYISWIVVIWKWGVDLNVFNGSNLVYSFDYINCFVSSYFGWDCRFINGDCIVREIFVLVGIGIINIENKIFLIGIFYWICSFGDNWKFVSYFVFGVIRIGSYVWVICDCVLIFEVMDSGIIYFVDGVEIFIVFVVYFFKFVNVVNYIIVWNGCVKCGCWCCSVICIRVFYKNICIWILFFCCIVKLIG